jgi:hypothetical protein
MQEGGAREVELPKRDVLEAVIRQVGAREADIGQGEQKHGRDNDTRGKCICKEDRSSGVGDEGYLQRSKSTGMGQWEN